MKETVTLLLNIARKSYLGADFRQAITYATQCKELALGREWLESQKILLLCFRELCRPSEMEAVRLEIAEFLKNASDDLKSLGLYLLAQQYAYRQEWPKAKGAVNESLEAALRNNNTDDLAYALFGSASVHLYQGDGTRAQEDLKKLEVILASHPRGEIQISLHFIKVNMAKENRNYDLALNELWRCYELARELGFHFYVPTILSYLANVHFESKAYQEAQFYLNLATRGVSEENQPLLFGYLEKQKMRLEKVLPREEFDLVVDIQNRIIHEKEKGAVDFRNQHTLLELALLFLKNPQTSFRKEDLIQKVWGQSYAPGSHDNLIYVTIKRLRALIEPDPDHPRYIMRNRQGYYFENSNKLHFKMGDSSL